MEKEYQVKFTVKLKHDKRESLSKKHYIENLNWVLTSHGYDAFDIEIEEVVERILCNCGRVTRYVSYNGTKMCEECYVKNYYIRQREKEKKEKLPTKSKVGSTFLQSTDL